MSGCRFDESGDPYLCLTHGATRHSALYDEACGLRAALAAPATEPMWGIEYEDELRKRGWHSPRECPALAAPATEEPNG